MSYMHPHIEGSRRRHLLSAAKRAPRMKGNVKPRVRARDQPTLHKFISGPTPAPSQSEEESEVEETSTAEAKGTRHFDRFDIKDPSLYP